MKLGTIIRLVVLVVLIAFLLSPQSFAFAFQPFATNGQAAIYTQNSLLNLTLNHLAIVALATIANVGQTFPPVAVLALAVPALGKFGTEPTLVALFLYGLLPIFENALTGLTTISPEVEESARATGMTEMQRLIGIELPIVLPVILAGVRLSVVIGIGTATIGSTVAASTLGEAIISGLINSNLAFILQGGLIVAVLAVLVSDAFGVLERWAVKRSGQLPARA